MTNDTKQKWRDRLWTLVAGIVTAVLIVMIMKGLMLDGFREELASELAKLRANVDSNACNYLALRSEFSEHRREDDTRDHRQDEELARHAERLEWLLGD